MPRRRRRHSCSNMTHQFVYKGGLVWPKHSQSGFGSVLPSLDGFPPPRKTQIHAEQPSQDPTMSSSHIFQRHLALSCAVVLLVLSLIYIFFCSLVTAKSKLVTDYLLQPASGCFFYQKVYLSARTKRFES